MSKPRPSTEKLMQKEDGSKCKTLEENAEVFQKHFEKLYCRTPIYDSSVLELLEQKPIANGYDHLPTEKEIRKAIQRLKNNAPGISGLSPQMFKALTSDPQTFELLELVITDFWENELAPEQWESGLLKILPKKGDLSKASNYRGIMFLEAAYKIVAIVVHERLQPIVENLDHEPQCGFRPGRGCLDAVFTVKLAMKKRREHNQETWILFLDLVKAFDRVPRELLWLVLGKFGVPAKLIRVIKSLHKQINVTFEVHDKSQTIICTIGVKQGDILGPILFVILIAAVMITWRVAYDRPLCMFRTKKDFVLTGRRHITKGLDFPLGDSEYADDTAVLFDNRESLQEFTPLLFKHFERFGMEVHSGDYGQPNKPSKTEILFVAAPVSAYVTPSTFDNKNLSPIELGNEKYIPIVSKFCYLGSLLSRDCRDNEDVLMRIKKSGNAFGALRKCLFSNVNVSYEAKRTVYEGLVLPILLYGAECWCLTENLLGLLRIFHHRCVRAMCRVNRSHVHRYRIRTQTLLDRLCLSRIDVYITKRQLGWVGHVARMGFDRLPRLFLSSWVTDKRPVGAPEYTYGRGLYKALKKANIEKSNWHVLAQNRVEWRKLMENVVFV